MSAPCGGEFCAAESCVCDYGAPMQEVYAEDTLQALHDDCTDAQHRWLMALDGGFPTEETDRLYEVYSAAWEAWVDAYTKTNGDPDWGAIQDGCD